ncbi:hypothetical protein KL909_002264 [Ogataea angusta]|nr:hypothetical protein KL909_002264 [Ogataea angusta]
MGGPNEEADDADRGSNSSSFSWGRGAGVLSGSTNWPTLEEPKPMAAEPAEENGVAWAPLKLEIGECIF